MDGHYSREAAEAAKVELYNRVWTDDAFSARLKSDPKAVFAEMGAELPDDLEIRVVSDSDKVKYVHIPAPPPEGEVSDEDLVNSHGGTTPLCALGSIVSAASILALISVHM